MKHAFNDSVILNIFQHPSRSIHFGVHSQETLKHVKSDEVGDVSND